MAMVRIINGLAVQLSEIALEGRNIGEKKCVFMGLKYMWILQADVKIYQSTSIKFIPDQQVFCTH